MIILNCNYKVMSNLIPHKLIYQQIPLFLKKLENFQFFKKLT